MDSAQQSEPNGKKEHVRQMFNNIAHRYDFLNHFLSVGIDRCWRRKLIRNMGQYNPSDILDVATGTADLAIAAAKLNPQKILGIDIAEEMLAIGQIKVDRLQLQKMIQLRQADSENLPFQDNCFDAVMVAFGVRNFENIDKGLAQMYRVLRQGGRVYILEFSKPLKFPVKQLYGMYFNHILPVLGRIVSKDMSAYTYLPESVGTFPDGPEFLALMELAGFRLVECKQLTFGVASLYYGQK
ncbi:MAG TPA: bifunctional demethylmenaquinone methyltransferase/2-methoxy-6-polyprenyl-1,4-benzoquinol methylase UbiE [Bacteroidales bacterium]